jgi:hypothetical protein
MVQVVLPQQPSVSKLCQKTSKVHRGSYLRWYTFSSFIQHLSTPNSLHATLHLDTEKSTVNTPRTTTVSIFLSCLFYSGI